MDNDDNLDIVDVAIGWLTCLAVIILAVLVVSVPLAIWKLIDLF